MRSRIEYERKQLTLIQEWKDVIAENARIGNLGDDELQWDSYTILKDKLRQEHINNKKKKKEREKARERKRRNFYLNDCVCLSLQPTDQREREGGGYRCTLFLGCTFSYH